MYANIVGVIEGHQAIGNSLMCEMFQLKAIFTSLSSSK